MKQLTMARETKKGNWRNLFKKPTLYEWTIFFMIIMSLFMAWAYQHDTEACRETLDNIEGTCLNYCAGLIEPIDNPEIDFGDIDFEGFGNPNEEK